MNRSNNLEAKGEAGQVKADLEKINAEQSRLMALVSALKASHARYGRNKLPMFFHHPLDPQNDTFNG